MENPATDSGSAAIRADKRHLSAPASRTGTLWLVLGLTLLLIAGLHAFHRHELHGLQQQLVATQESFAGLGEESLQQLQQLDDRTTGLAALQGRVQGMLLEQGRLRQQVQGLMLSTDGVDALQAGQKRLQQELPGLTRQLDEQSRMVEQAALALDAAQQKLQARQDKFEKIQDEQDEALSSLALELTTSLQEWQLLDRQQKELQLIRLAALEQELQLLLERMDAVAEDSRHAELQQSVLKLAQRVEAERQRRQQLEEEMAAFRLQVTRTQDRLLQRLNTVQQ